ncbi:YodC family protein [Peristeroidobacter soli]|uniref:YodC family protein n=1 Tax=Peristeroidobacter soli TaxID=2497877 RepID=UPI00101C62A4
MSESFAIGDVVQLKSGGQPMTVEEVDDNDISCVWFEAMAPKGQTFVAGTLKKYLPPSGGFRVSRA